MTENCLMLKLISTNWKQSNKPIRLFAGGSNPPVGYSFCIEAKILFEQETTMKITKRSLVRQILSRDKNYLLSTYVRLIGKKMGRTYNRRHILDYLNRLQKQHVISYHLNGKRIVGFFVQEAFAA